MFGYRGVVPAWSRWSPAASRSLPVALQRRCCSRAPAALLCWPAACLQHAGRCPLPSPSCTRTALGTESPRTPWWRLTAAYGFTITNKKTQLWIKNIKIGFSLCLRRSNVENLDGVNMAFAAVCESPLSPCLLMSCHPSRPSLSRSIKASSPFMNRSLRRGGGHIWGGDGSTCERTGRESSTIRE